MSQDISWIVQIFFEEDAPKISGNMRRISFSLVASVTLLFILANNCEAMGGQESIDIVPTATAHKITEKPTIRKILVEGNQAITTRAILEKIPFKPGDLFDRKKTKNIIRSIYRLGYFKNIQVITDDVQPGVIDLILAVVEKNRISGLTFEGNSAISEEKITTALDTSHIKTLDEEELRNLEQKIEKQYKEKGYHHTTIQGTLQPDDKGTFLAHFVINEGRYSRVRRVDFKGNKHIADLTLRTKIFTREDWPLGFLDRAGFYHPDAVMRDKYVIEDLYQSQGYLSARVIDTIVQEDKNGCIDITFVVEEGDLYCISSVAAPGNEIFNEEQLLYRIPIRPGQLYSKDLIRKTMEQLRMLWGEFGYIYADVQPQIRPNEQDKTVAITFVSDLGNQITVNRINIVGNKKTRDNVIRREILFDEGCLLTSWFLEESKRRIQLLGFFDQKDGVNWKIIKLDEETADLDLVLNEVKTGRLNGKVGFGPQGDVKSTTDSFSVGLDVSDSNFRGSGIMYNFSGSYSKQDKIFIASIANRWLFDRPIFGGAECHYRSTTYEDFTQTVEPPIQHTIGGSANTGFRVTRWLDLQIALAGGFDNIRNIRELVAKIVSNDPDVQRAFNQNIKQSFQPGDLAWVSTVFSQDTRNHPIYPTDGYTWQFDNKIGLPFKTAGFGFAKLQFDANWYTPIIPAYGLALHVRTFVGLVHLFDGYIAPYRELFHIGGPATVRGFKFGQIGPSINGSSLGATKAFTFSSELQFPITEDYNMRGVLFYDGGAGWKTPDARLFPDTKGRAVLINNELEYRQAIGFGIRMTSPQPICVDWGFKLDPKRKRGESVSEVSFSTSSSF